MARESGSPSAWRIRSRRARSAGASSSVQLSGMSCAASPHHSWIERDSGDPEASGVDSHELLPVALACEVGPAKVAALSPMSSAIVAEGGHPRVALGVSAGGALFARFRVEELAAPGLAWRFFSSGIRLASDDSVDVVRNEGHVLAPEIFRGLLEPPRVVVKISQSTIAISAEKPAHSSSRVVVIHHKLLFAGWTPADFTLSILRVV